MNLDLPILVLTFIKLNCVKDNVFQVPDCTFHIRKFGLTVVSSSSHVVHWIFIEGKGVNNNPVIDKQVEYNAKHSGSFSYVISVSYFALCPHNTDFNLFFMKHHNLQTIIKFKEKNVYSCLPFFINLVI